MRNERSKNILLGLLVVGLVSMSIAYAALSSTLKIGNSDTTATVHGGTWNIIFENGSAQTPVGNDVTWVGTPTLTNGKISGIRANFGLTSNGEIKYRFRMSNYGNIDAKITNQVIINKTCKINDSVVSLSNDVTICNSITGTLKYLDKVQKMSDGFYEEAGEGVTVSQNDLLPANSYVDAELTITVPDIVENIVPSGDMTVEFADIDIIYGQTTETPTEGSLAFQPSYYAYGEPTTSNTSIPSQPVFGAMDTLGRKGICIKRSSIIHCFQENNFEYESQHILQALSNLSCSSSSNSVTCKYNGTGCSVYSTGRVNCSYNNVINAMFTCNVTDGIISCKTYDF